ncbi:flagellar biosynthesis protein FlhB [Caminibacter mediatlanticus]|uniref:Flagellar biosynthetic protein FlhB n=1 Tax=Caminibacter mediatlanticus TB-2 TaxID=391592 RepID=A0AAI9AJ52_9BACT|nr:flagellar biosynthesis protein FlhB [Caminibacter mediatlanticus]EDM24623.1 flagellar biosynthetic protein FlhB [Caminibacter mediatlanticus TB-2]
MADDLEKTEEPTPKKLEEAKKEGNIAKSMEVSGFVVLLVGSIIILFYLKYVTFYLEEYFRYFYSYIGVELTKNIFFNLIIKSTYYFFILIAPIFIALILAGIIGNVMQFGFLFTIKPILPKLEKINPIKGLKRLFSVKTLVEGLKTTLKTFIAFLVGFTLFYNFLQEIPRLELMNFFEQLKWFEDKAVILIFSLLGVFFIFAIIDFTYQKYTYKKSLRMSKQEIKDEYKQTEGNPEVKAKIRQLQREMAKKRMMAEVPKADVVITNPTHYAVAIRYDKTKDEAPRVVAKGVDNLAIKIKEIAREAGVMIVENPPLARELYKSVEVGEIIPQKLFKAVAEVLAYVYRAKRMI